jgi:hypothetical protein
MCSWNTKTCSKFSHASNRATLYHFKNIFLFLHMLLTCSFRWNTSTGKHTTFTQCIQHLGKHSTIRNSAYREPSMVFFNSSSGSTIAVAVNVQHISIFGICEDVRHFSQHSYNVTINNHNDQLTLHTDWHASDSDSLRGREDNIGRQIQTTVQWNSYNSEKIQIRTRTYTVFA